ncbi:MAG: type II toxin-antitoxin system RelE/ParE family toxin [Candidatus Nanopelagicales bacterium]
MADSWRVEVDLVDAWLLSLDQKSYEQVIAALELLAERGPSLGRPVVDSVVGSRHKNMKELRPGSSGRSELRVLFAFDPDRRAIMLVAGDKAGNWQKWYRTNIPLADDLFAEHLSRSRKGDSRG